jgi:hypothetical protein
MDRCAIGAGLGCRPLVGGDENHHHAVIGRGAACLMRG